MSKKVEGQKKYIVSVTKTFEFPSCVLDKGDRLRDAYAKAWEDYVDGFLADPQKFRSKMKIELFDKVPYNLRTKKKDNQGYIMTGSGQPVELSYVIKMMAESETEAEYGVLDYNQNPDLFELEDNHVFDDDGNIIEENWTPYLRDDVSNFYENCYETLLKKVRSKIL